MSGHITAWVTCDGCGFALGKGFGLRTITVVRRVLIGRGWVSAHGKDYCPECKEKR